MLWHVIDDWFKPPRVFEERLKTFKPDVLYSNTLTGLTASAWKLAKKYNVKIAHTLRDYYLICPKCTYFSNDAPCEQMCSSCDVLTINRRGLTQYVDAVVGNSKFILDTHLKFNLFGKAKIKRAIGSISEATMGALGPRETGDLTKTIYGYIGRVTREKGVMMLAEAYAQLPEWAHLVIAGETDPALMQQLRDLAQGREITFLGYVDPKFFYESVDIVVAPSIWHEPLPRSVVDAVAFGRPVVGSNRGGIPESMGEPAFGWIYDPAIDGDLEAKMRLAYDSYRTFADSHTPAPPAMPVIQAYIETFETIR